MPTKPTDYLTPQRWIQQHFGDVALGDQRRNQRAMALATAMLRRPSASLPAQVASPAALKAAYRLLASDDVAFRARARPQWEQTRAQARHAPLVVLVHDTTELDCSHHPTTTGLGPIGDNPGRGIFLHSTLAVLLHPRTVLGLAAQEPFLRQPSPQPKGSGAATRRGRTREAHVWERALAGSGRRLPMPAGCMGAIGMRILLTGWRRHVGRTPMFSCVRPKTGGCRRRMRP